MRNLITDVAGLKVGHATDLALASGVTAILFDAPTVASVDVRGGGPGTRETDLLAPDETVGAIHAITLSGGSAFGLDAAGGVMAALAERGIGYPVGPAIVPIVPGAVLFDLVNGGDKNWGRFSPYRDLGYAAAMAAGLEVPLGTVGAGTGATTVNLKGGLGSASMVAASGHTVGAIVAVNACGATNLGEEGHFWAAPFETGGEFGGLGLPSPLPPLPERPALKGLPPGANTTIALVATDAVLTKAQCKRLAVMAHDGYAHAIWPVHTPLDGDTIFAAATGLRPLADPIFDLALIGDAIVRTLARACARAVYEATALPQPGTLPAWRDQWPGQRRA
ncbi:L-aminopeptidase/D-esterase-like protein [Angulomicrobium tetraedrale]|uniref:L-aminopeptidase/D-esterase-like protein n=1 Tax=Ancylobacter tetraedralis TaxID=217068 RepID=A0A839Z9P1_9HYPH|nr:P1 family peptidase [Ancylobacter tetraedralis]MBB3771453.1 L-aminopeptidase/D-esterase-like protein [Ancylobacter tetraedralis]